MTARHPLEHPAVVRLCHWALALATVALIGSGLEVFATFPAFGEKMPPSELFVPPPLLRIGGWLGGRCSGTSRPRGC